MKPIYPYPENKIDVTNDSLLEEFVQYRELAERTVILYIYSLNMYCNYIGKTIKEFIEEAEDEEEERIRMRRRKIVKYLIDFNNYLEELGFAKRSIGNTMMSVKAFYSHFDIQLQVYKRKNSRKATVLKNIESIDAIPTMEELQRFLSICNDLYRVVALFGISSGMGQAEIGNLTYKHLFEACELDPYPETMKETIKRIKAKGHFIPTWHIERVKTGMKYFTFTSPELMKHLLIYMEEYHRRYPEFNPKPEDQLIRSLKNHGKPIKREGVGKYFGWIGDVHELRKYNNRYVCTSHGFRRFFASTLEAHKVPHLTIRRIMGHKSDKVTNSYFKIDPKDAKEDYLEAVNALSTDQAEIMQVNIYDDIKDLKLEMVEVKRYIDIPKK